jgi:hypothetical protein
MKGTTINGFRAPSDRPEPYRRVNGGFQPPATEKAQLSQSLPNWIKGVNLSTPTIGAFHVQCSRFKVFKTFKSFKRRKAIGYVLPISFCGKLKQLAKMKGTGL